MRSSSQWSAKRKAVKTLLRPYAVPSYRRALLLVALDLTLFFMASIMVVAAPGLAWKLAASCGLGLVLARMFVLGHDAGHQSLTPSRALNAWLGRILFLPTMTCLSLWVAGHNIAHHGFSGLRGRDIPWVPLSPEQYLALSRGKRWLYRVYRSWWGAGLYYGLDVWWRQQYFPQGKVRRAFILDSWLVTIFMAAQTAAYGVAALATGQSVAVVLALGIALPFVLWLYMAAIVFYVHHTDETCRWYDNEREWRAAQPNLDATHGTHLPLRLDLLLHHALEHTAHHVNTAIPSYRLTGAQRALEKHYPAEVPLRKITLGRYVAITKQCQLYDARLHEWLTFDAVEATQFALITR
jgi:omega-6 fatty acid desaturase (delta-12 desaturase)